MRLNGLILTCLMAFTLQLAQAETYNGPYPMTSPAPMNSMPAPMVSPGPMPTTNAPSDYEMQEFNNQLDNLQFTASSNNSTKLAVCLTACAGAVASCRLGCYLHPTPAACRQLCDQAQAQCIQGCQNLTN